MSVQCDIILKWGATSAQLAALGTALWRWCNRTVGRTALFQSLNNQGLADLIAGKLPVSGGWPRQADQRGVHYWLRDETSQDRQATIASLRRDMPTAGIEDVMVDGASWDRSD
jgi:hypothetical protein